MSGIIGVLIVDDHRLICDALSRCLDNLTGVRVLGQAHTASEAIASAISQAPDVVLMDVPFSQGPDGFQLASRIGNLRPRARFIFLTGEVADSDVDQALLMRGSSFLTKDVSLTTLQQAVREAGTGGRVFCKRVQARLSDNGHHRRPSKPRSRLASLTPRELEVLRYRARGLAYKQIAREMGIEVKTVDSHFYNIMKKLDVHDRISLIRFAIREGVVTI